MFVHRVEVYSV